MNFDDAVKAHVGWKMKLASYLKKPDGSLKAQPLQRTDGCELGKWIEGEAAVRGKDPDFEKLQRAHVAFHRAAADVVTRADSGASVAEDVALGASSPFAKASTEVVMAIMTIKNHAKQH